MTDNHVHIGQYEEVYYDGLEVVDTVLSCGMKGLSFSSTSSCKDKVSYIEIEKEILTLLSQISYQHEKIRPFFWYIPEYIDQNISVQSAFATIPYKGIKLHPYVNNWDFENSQHMEALNSLFDHAGQNGLPILIHTGHSGMDSADRFEHFFHKYKETQCILAHSRPLDTTIEMLKKYPNVLCDTAFVQNADIRLLISRGYKERILFGSDFPITHYFANKYPQDGIIRNVSLIEQYRNDVMQILSNMEEKL